MLVPARRAANRVDTQRSEPPQIVRRRIRRREFYGYIHSSQKVVHDPGIVQVAFAREFCAHVETILGRELRNEASHLSATHNGQAQAHAALRPVASSCVVMRM